MSSASRRTPRRRFLQKTGRTWTRFYPAVVNTVPPPVGDPDAPLTALVFDCIYDNYKGALSYVRIFDGTVKQGMRIRSMATGHEFEVTEVGVFSPAPMTVDELTAGEVGYIAASIKSVAETKVGDTITSAERPAAKPLPGYKHANPMVFLRQSIRRTARSTRT